MQTDHKALLQPRNAPGRHPLHGTPEKKRSDHSSNPVCDPGPNSPTRFFAIALTGHNRPSGKAISRKKNGKPRIPLPYALDVRSRLSPVRSSGTRQARLVRQWAWRLAALTVEAATPEIGPELGPSDVTIAMTRRGGASPPGAVIGCRGPETHASTCIEMPAEWRAGILWTSREREAASLLPPGAPPLGNQTYCIRVRDAVLKLACPSCRVAFSIH
jgi:hypothetical protein